MAPNPVRSWRVSDEIAQLVKDYAAVRNTPEGEAAETLLRKALIAELDADPSLKAAIDAMQAARTKGNQ